MKIILSITLSIFTFFWPSFPQNSDYYTLEGRIIGIKDGDTIEILINNEQSELVRLSDIDAPEKKQAFGTVSKAFLAKECFGRRAILHCQKKRDRYQRIIAELYVNNVNINKKMVANGMAWQFKKYSKNADYAQLENTARAQKKGLWMDKSPIAPWDWRKQKKQVKQYN